jgi:hypothetical protein
VVFAVARTSVKLLLSNADGSKRRNIDTGAVLGAVQCWVWWQGAYSTTVEVRMGTT